MPTTCAIVRVLQWVALRGFSRIVLSITLCTLAGVIVGVRPGRGASFSRAASPPSRKRLRQRADFSGVMLNSRAISLSCIPSAARSTMRARSTTRDGRERARARCSNCSRCFKSNVTARAMRMGCCLLIVKMQQHTYSLLFMTRYTSMKTLLVSVTAILFITCVAPAYAFDLGAQIIQDDAALGTNPGEIHVIASSSTYIQGEIQSINTTNLLLENVTFAGGGNLVYWSGVTTFTISGNTILSITAVHNNSESDFGASGFYLLHCSDGNVTNLTVKSFVFPPETNTAAILGLSLSSNITVTNPDIEGVDASFIRFGAGAIAIAGSDHIIVN